jgi:glycosyltransferase involved in cell wall biosynthesis
MSASGPRLAVVLSHPTQYYSPWFRWLAAHTAVQLRVFYLWDFGVQARTDPQFGATFRWDVDLLSGYASEFVPNVARHPGTDRFFGLRNPGLTSRLAAWRPDALLIFGYAWASPLRALFWARRHRVPAVLRGDSHLLGRPRPGWARSLPRRFILSRFAAIACVGSANRRYFETLGVPARRLFFAPHAVDASRFEPDAPSTRAAAAALRAELGLAPAVRIVLFAGKLVAAKQPGELLQAFRDLAPPDAALVFVGEGRERAELERRAAESPALAVRFLPFANQTEMPVRLQLADLFVLPSRGAHESWGLAVNEAMHLGVPALVSDRVGCQEDLVSPGETGWVFRADDPDDLRRQLARALAELADPDRRAELRQAVLRRIAGYTYAQASAGLLQALAALPPAPGPPGRREPGPPKERRP